MFATHSFLTTFLTLVLDKLSYVSLNNRVDSNSCYLVELTQNLLNNRITRTSFPNKKSKKANKHSNLS